MGADVEQPLLSQDQEERFFAGVRFTGDFFMGTSRVHAALDRLTSRLEEAKIPYAIIGAMALNEYGYRRATEDVDVLLRPDGLKKFRETWLGRGYVERFPGSRGLRDTESNVMIDVVLAGDYPGDGRPKPVAFPDPESASRGRRVRLLPIERLIELKLASGMSAPHRLRDLADVLELIRVAGLPRDFGEKLDESVRGRFVELWESAQHAEPE